MGINTNSNVNNTVDNNNIEVVKNLWTWFWSKETWLQGIQLLNIILAANNIRRDLVLREDKYHSKSEVGQEWNVTRNVEELSLKPWRQDVVLGIQVIVLILQATTSYQYAKEVNDVRETAGYDFKVQNLDEKNWTFTDTFNYYFNKKSSTYITIMEHILNSIVALAKAGGEIGGMK